MELKRLLAILSLLLAVAKCVPALGAPEEDEAAAPAPLLDFQLRETSVVSAMRNVLEALRDSLMSQSGTDGNLEISSLLDAARKQLGSPSLRDLPPSAGALDALSQELVDSVKDVAVQEVALEAFRQVFTDAALSGVDDEASMADQASATIEMGQVLQKIQERLKAGGFPDKLVRQALPAISGCGLRFDQAATSEASEAAASPRSLQRLNVPVPLLLEEELGRTSLQAGELGEEGVPESAKSQQGERSGADAARGASSRRLAVIESIIDAAVGRPGYGGNYGPNYGYGYRPYDRYGGGGRGPYNNNYYGGGGGYNGYNHYHHHHQYDGGRPPYPGGDRRRY